MLLWWELKLLEHELVVETILAEVEQFVNLSSPGISHFLS